MKMNFIWIFIWNFISTYMSYEKYSYEISHIESHRKFLISFEISYKNFISYEIACLMYYYKIHVNVTPGAPFTNMV